MGNVVTHVYVKFNYDWLRIIDKDLGDFRNSDNSNKNNSVRSAWRPFPSPKTI